MPPESQDRIRARAIDWHIRLRDGDDPTWEAFAAWLAEDESHAKAYDEIEQMDLALEPLLPHVVIREAANDVGQPATPLARPTRRWMIVGGALAASAAVAVVVFPQLASSRYEVVTRPGQPQVVELDAVTKVTLNGATRMTFDRRNPRYAVLATGEALFHVRHDESNPFRLKVAGKIVEDVGTIFNVVHQAGEVRVAVAEGKVVYDAKRDAVVLNPGQLLIDRAEAREVRVINISTAIVGSWTTGSLVYSAAPLSQVAADLGRALGVRIAVSAAIADRSFSGSIRLDGSGPDQLVRLAPALNVRLTRTADGWTMEPVDGAGQ